MYIETLLVTYLYFKKDWVSTVYKDLEYLGLKVSFSEIEVMGNSTYKKLIKKKIREQAFLYLIEKVNNCDGKGKKFSIQSCICKNTLGMG